MVEKETNEENTIFKNDENTNQLDVVKLLILKVVESLLGNQEKIIERLDEIKDILSKKENSDNDKT